MCSFARPSRQQRLAQKSQVNFLETELLNFRHRNESAVHVVRANERRIVSKRLHSKHRIEEVRGRSAPIRTLTVKMSNMNETDYGNRSGDPACLLGNFAQQRLLDGLALLHATTHHQPRPIHMAYEHIVTP